MDPANLIRAPLARQRPLTRGLRRRASTTVGHFKRVDCISEDVRPRDRVSAFEQGTASGSLPRLLVLYLLEASLRRSSQGQRRHAVSTPTAEIKSAQPSRTPWCSHLNVAFRIRHMWRCFRPKLFHVMLFVD